VPTTTHGRDLTHKERMRDNKQHQTQSLLIYLSLIRQTLYAQPNKETKQPHKPTH